MTPPIGSARAGLVSQVDAIPDSVALQYYATTWSQGDATWFDDTDTADMSINGDPQDATLSDGSESIAADGSDDHGLTTFPSSLEGNSLQSFAWEVAMEKGGDTDGQINGINNTGDQSLQISWNLDETGTTDTGNFSFFLRDIDGNVFRFAPQNNPELNDESRHDITVSVDDSTNNSATIIIDGTSVDVAVGTAGSPSNFGSWDYGVASWARNNDGTIDSNLAIETGAFRWHDTGISEQTIDVYPE